jgi:hypothetical protein
MSWSGCTPKQVGGSMCALCEVFSAFLLQGLLLLHAHAHAPPACTSCQAQVPTSSSDTPTCRAGPRASGGYVMNPNNPFLTDTDSFAKGRELFRRVSAPYWPSPFLKSLVLPRFCTVGALMPINRNC